MIFTQSTRGQEILGFKCYIYKFDKTLKEYRIFRCKNGDCCGFFIFDKK